jgi:hypothetical protein
MFFCCETLRNAGALVLGLVRGSEFFAATASCRGRSAPIATTGGGEAHTKHPPAKLVAAQKRLENSH